MPRYTMPDGSVHDFSSDDDATRAMKAWQTQFGNQENEFSLGSAASAVGRTALGMVGAIPQGLRAIGETAIGGAEGAWDRSASSNLSEWFPEGNAKTKQYQEKIGQGLEKVQEFLGEGVNIGGEVTGLYPGISSSTAKRLEEAEKDPKKRFELEQQHNALRTIGEGLGNFVPLPLIKGKGKTKAADLPPVERRKAIDEDFAQPSKKEPNYTEDYQFWKERAEKMTQDARNTPIQVTPEGQAVPRDLELATKAIDEQKPIAPQYGVETPKTQEVFGYTTELKTKTREPTLMGETPKPDDGFVRGEIKVEDPTTALATNHTHPTNEFMLRPEYIDADPTVQTLLRQEAQRLTEAQKGGVVGKEASKELRAIRQELERHGWTGYGSGDKPGLFGFGKDTALPIEKTGARDTRTFPEAGKPFDPFRNSKGRFVPKSQRGAISPELLGAGKVSDLLTKLGPTELLGKFKGTFNSKALNFAINDSLDPKSRSRLVWVSPTKFLELAKNRFPKSRPDLTQQMRDMAGPKIRSIREGLRSSDGLRDIPFLNIDGGKVTGHEGRHRAHTMEKMGVDLMPVVLRDSMHRVESGPLPYHQLMSEDKRIVDISDIKEIFPNGGKQLGQTFAGSSQRGSVPDVGESPLLKGLFKAFGKKEEVGPTKFEQAVSTEQATKALPGTGKVFDGVSRVPDDPKQLLTEYADSITPEKDLTDTQLKVGLTVQSGANLKARNTNNPFVKYSYQAFDNAYTEAAILKNTFVDPISKLESKINKQELQDLAYLAKKIEGTDSIVDRARLERLGFSENAISFWEAVQTGLKAKLDHTNKILGEIGQKTVEPRSNYFASTFKGNYKAIVRDKETGQPVFVLAEKTPKKLDALLNKFKTEKGKEFDFDVLDFDYVKHNKGEVEFALNEFNRLAEAGDPRIEAVKSLYEEYLQRTASYSKGGNQHLKEKSKVAVGGAEGYRLDRTELQNAKDFWKAQLEYIEKGFVWGENQKMFHNIGEAIKGIQDKLPNTSTYMNQYRLNAIGVRRNTLGKVSDILEREVTNAGIPIRDIAEWSKGTLNSMLLGGPNNIVFAATQLIQVINATPDLKIMLERKGINPVEAAVSASKSLNMSNPITREAWKWAETNHVARAAVFGDSVELGSSSAARMAHIAGDVWNVSPKEADRVGRSYVFLNAVHMLIDSGVPKKEAFQTAADLTNRAMVDYRAPESPMAMSSGGLIGNTSLFLMKYPANWWNQFFSHMTSKDLISFGALVGALGLTAGVLGAAGIEAYEAIRSVWNNQLGQGSKGRRLPSFNELAIESGMPNWMLVGPLSTVTGIDFSSKTGMKDTIGNSASDIILPGSGFAGKAIGSTASLALDPTSQSKQQKAIHDVLPTSLKGISEEAFYTDPVDKNGKALIRNPEKGTGEYRRDSFDRAIRFAGGRSTEEAIAKTKDYTKKTSQLERQQYRTEALDSLIKEILADKNTFSVAKKTEKAAQVFVKLGGDPQRFEAALQDRYLKSKLTPAERAMLESNPQELQRTFNLHIGR